MKKLFDTILNPVDFSESSTSAYQLAKDLARAHGARLVVLHVCEPLPVEWDPGFGLVDTAGLEEQIRGNARRQLKNYAAAAPEIGMKTEVRSGVPVREILASAKKHRAGLIVLGTHGRTGFSRLLMGSVAEKVARTAPCSVLTVHAPSAGGKPGKSRIRQAGKSGKTTSRA